MDQNKHDIKRTINKIIRDKGRFPNKQEMCDILNYSELQVINYMNALVDDGYIERIGSWYKFPDYAEIDEPVITYTGTQQQINVEDYVSIEEDSKILEVKPRVRSPRGKRKPKQQGLVEEITVYGMPVYIIQATMGIIGVGASVISIYYTTFWLLEFLPFAFALLLSSIMTGFSVSAFETVILFLSGQVTKSKWAKIVVAVSFMLLFIVVSCFSMMSTVAGQYNKHVARLQEKQMTDVGSGKTSWSLLQEQKSDLKQQIEEQRQQISLFNKILAGMNTVESKKQNERAWAETQWRLQKAVDSVSTMSLTMDKIREQEKKHSDKSKNVGMKDIKNFYGWISGITDIAEDKVQFWMSLFPAVFVDIISPVGIALALFLRKKYKKDEV